MKILTVNNRLSQVSVNPRYVTSVERSIARLGNPALNVGTTTRSMTILYETEQEQIKDFNFLTEEMEKNVLRRPQN